jgi:DNA-binding beta-propeller fold protein YncE
MVLDTGSRTITDTLAIDFAGSIVFTPDGSRAYISIDGNFGFFSQVKVIDTATHTVVDTIQLPVPTAPLGLAASNDGTRIYVCGWVTNDVTVLDIDPASSTYHTVIKTIPVGGSARGIALTPSGNLAYVTLDTGGVDVVITNPSNSQFHQVIAHIAEAGPSGGIHGIATSLDGRFQYVSVGAPGHNQLYVIDSDYFSSTFNTVINMFTVGQVPLGIGARPHR